MKRSRDSNLFGPVSCMYVCVCYIGNGANSITVQSLTWVNVDLDACLY